MRVAAVFGKGGTVAKNNSEDPAVPNSRSASRVRAYNRIERNAGLSLKCGIRVGGSTLKTGLGKNPFIGRMDVSAGLLSK